MKTRTSFTPVDVAQIAKLANIPITSDEAEKLAQGFNRTIAVVEQLNQIDTSQVSPTHQVTGLTNIFREDVVDEARMFTQEEALLNAKDTHEGYFVVEQILEGD
jgi:aspartyl-tRNA(Asn)/glutamyl-tRNA(Gln) amidotransferase subunit C